MVALLPYALFRIYAAWRKRRWLVRPVALAALAALALAGCGKANLATAPDRPLYVCAQAQQPCPHPFDARRLLGLEISDAEREAGALGFTVRPVRIDGRGVPSILDYESNRIDVELRDRIVVKIRGRG